MAKERITITLEPEDLKRIDRIASVQRIPRSTWIQRALHDVINQEEAVVKFFSDSLLRDTVVKALCQPGVFGQLAEAVGAELTDSQLKLFVDRLQGVVRTSKGRK